MKRLDGFRAGINLGGWISQYADAPRAHFDTFITRGDLARIASWGMDHVRLPVDYFTFESDDAPGAYLEDGLRHIDDCLSWCGELGLNMILDLHVAPGFNFVNGNRQIWETAEENDLFTNPAKQERFLGIWRMFAKRYRSEGRNLIFELMNELLAESTEPWNDLWKRCVAEIRKIDPDRTIVVGGNKNNECSQLQSLDLIDDPGVVYTFHCYEPGMFTHYHAPFISYLKDYPIPVTYPMRRADHQAFFDAFDKMGMVPPVYRREVFDKDFLREDLEPARKFMAETGRELFCGEFGVYTACDIESSVRWFSDITGVFDELGVGHTVWNYTGFSHIMTDGSPRREDCRRIIDIVSRKRP